MKAFFHSSDLDGQCSGAIVKRFYPECRLIGINYGQPFPWDDIEPNEPVFMVDFCLQPFEDMVRLANMATLVWIDHHKSAIEESVAYHVDKAIPGLRQVGLAGCELTWTYIQEFVMRDKKEKEPVPLAVTLIGAYDTWRKDIHVEEVMKDIPGYEGIYAISNLGRVFRYERPIKNQVGDTGARAASGWMSPSLSNSGYLQVCFSKDGQRESRFIHRLVAAAFVPGEDETLNEVNHIDGDKDNNRYDNLEWASRHQNEGHAFKVLHKGTSVFHGVSYNAARDRWKASVTIAGSRKFIGYFQSEKEAARAYDDFVVNGVFDASVAIPLNFKPSKRGPTITATKQRVQWETSILPFQYGMRVYDTHPNNQNFWKPFLSSYAPPSIDAVIERGVIILDYQKKQNAKYVSAAAFPVMLDGLKCIAVNRLLGNSKLFDSVWDPEPV